MTTRRDRITSYAEFWPYYLREHAKPETRLWHIVGIGAASILLVAALAAFSFELFFAALIVGYGPAWFAHLMLERNRPATFRYPFWSLVSDFRMTGFWLSGQLGDELLKAGIANDEPAR